MTQEDKAVITEYMGWKFDTLMSCYRCVGHYSDPVPINFDLNDAGLCVEKMSETLLECDFISFLGTVRKLWADDHKSKQVMIAWLFNSQNFFQALSAWLRSK